MLSMNHQCRFEEIYLLYFRSICGNLSASYIKLYFKCLGTLSMTTPVFCNIPAIDVVTFEISCYIFTFDGILLKYDCWHLWQMNWKFITNSRQFQVSLQGPKYAMIKTFVWFNQSNFWVCFNVFDVSHCKWNVHIEAKLKNNFETLQNLHVCYYV